MFSLKRNCFTTLSFQQGSLQSTIVKHLIQIYATEKLAKESVLSLDIKNLFTNIPVNETLAIKQYLSSFKK